ncbi:MAG: type II toxin-antitoxin system VapC family toxin, partial [Micrococcales bacterium]|nr:type II toxin-antitoxin system VapC family toxin [Micrococcales bacterium]
MGRRLILDTNILIRRERGLVGPFGSADDDLAMAAVTLAELERGLHTATDPHVIARRRAYIERLPA